VPFERKPESPDRELEKKLMDEAPAILQWMIDGCIDWQNAGLSKPNSVLAATEEYFSDQDLFAHWLEDQCQCEPGNNDLSGASSALFKSWKEYATNAGNTPGSQQSFKDQMVRHGFKFIRGRKAREFFGIRIKPKATYHD
jgi:putative DNA primase/helicase